MAVLNSVNLSAAAEGKINNLINDAARILADDKGRNLASSARKFEAVRGQILETVQPFMTVGSDGARIGDELMYLVESRAENVRDGRDPESQPEIVRKMRFGRESDSVAADGEFGAHPLSVPRDALGKMQRAIIEGRPDRLVIQNAALDTTTYGGPTEWGSNVLRGPRLLHVQAGAPQQHVAATSGEFPKLTLPSAAAGVGEGVSLTEYASSTAGTVTLKRYGRYTDLTREAQVGASASALTAMHLVSVARDLDDDLISKVETDAGAAVAFAADVPGQIRKAMASVIDNTGAVATDLVILVHPDNVSLLQDVTPASGTDVADGFTRFSGAAVYPSSSVTTGFMTVCNMRAGVRYFQAQSVQLETDIAIKTAVTTYATSTIGGYGTGLISGYAIMQDVVTP